MQLDSHGMHQEDSVSTSALRKGPQPSVPQFPHGWRKEILENSLAECLSALRSAWHTVRFLRVDALPGNRA